QNKYLKCMLYPADHIQGKILFSDLFRLPSVGELHPGATRQPPAVFCPATRFPDLRALEADLHGNYRCGECPLESAAVPRHLCGSCVGLYCTSSAAAALAYSGLEVMGDLSDGSSGGDFSVYTGWIFSGLLSAPGGGIPAGWGDSRKLPLHAEADSGGSEPCGRCHSVQRRHHGDLHSPSLLLRLHFVHPDRDCGHVGLHGPCSLQQTPRCCAKGQPGCGSSRSLGSSSALTVTPSAPSSALTQFRAPLKHPSMAA
uniref:Uncharacterized protein n=1 Tax=Amphiprion percula TaxID=161767 RepID=A0A3P8T936_AMPPE